MGSEAVRRRNLCAFAAFFAGCSGGTVLAPPASQLSRSEVGGPIHYEVTPHDGGGRLSVVASVPSGLPAALHVDRSMVSWVQNTEIESAAGWSKVPFDDGVWQLPGCAGGCQIRYEYDLAGAAAATGDVGYAAVHGGMYLAPPSTWLLHPAEALEGVGYRFHVRDDRDIQFITGVLPVSGAAPTYGADLSDLPDSPYSAFGRFDLLRLTHAGSAIEVAVAGGAQPAGDERSKAFNETLMKLVEDSARAVSSYYGRFPLPHTALIVLLEDGSDLGFASTLGNGGGAVVMRIGRDVAAPRLLRSWQTTHEMLHLAFPNLPRQNRWFEEGMATYIEPIARARVGALSDEEVWRGMVKGMPFALPQPGEGGLDDTPTWGRTYWGGALFCLLADVQIRETTGNARSLADAMRAILEHGGNAAARWPIERALAVGDAGTGTTVLRDLHGRMGSAAVQTDLPELWARLGIRNVGGQLTFDDTAPLAAVRRAITAPPAPGIAPAPTGSSH